MKHPTQEIGSTNGLTIETARLIDLDSNQMMRYAVELLDITMRTIDEPVPDIGAPLYGLAEANRTIKQMKGIRRTGIACALVFIDSDLVGVTEKDYNVKAGDTPIQIARPAQSSRRLSYWLVPEYKADVDANAAVASTLVGSSEPTWQWDYVVPGYEQTKLATYASLGMVGLGNTEQHIRTMNGSGVKGVELWAKAPIDDNDSFAATMMALDEEVRDLHAFQDAASDARWAQRVEG